MGFVESPTVHGHVRSGDVTTRATLTAYAVRDIDGVTYVAGTDIPGLPFTPAPARLPLGSLASASTPVPGATCSFTADSDEARSCANDGQGNFTTDLVGGLVAASTTTWTGLILLNVIPDKTPTPAVTRKPGYIVGCQITMWRTASLDGAGAESVLVGGYTLSSGSVGPTGTELPLATGLQIRKTSPPDRQYRALPYDIQQRIAAATTPKFYVTVGGLQSGVKGISLADVLSFAGSMLSKTRTGGPGEYLGGETGDWPTIPGTRAGKTLIGADVSTVPVVAGVNSTNCANFPIFPLSFHFALSPDNTPVSRRFVTVGIRVSVLINAAVVTSSQLVDDVSFVVMGQLQSACTLVNPAKDPRLALLLGMPTIDPGPNTTQRTEAVPITRLCSTVKPVIIATYKYRNAQGTTVVAEVPGQGIASAVLRLETVTSVTLAIPSQLPASEATMLDRSRWVDVGAGTEVFHIFAYAIQSVARVTANGEQPLTLAFIPGPPEIFGNYDSDGYLQDARVTDENTSWLYVERFDVDVGSGERSGWTTK
jgi:hypothetical protein